MQGYIILFCNKPQELKQRGINKKSVLINSSKATIFFTKQEAKRIIKDTLKYADIKDFCWGSEYDYDMISLDFSQMKKIRKEDTCKDIS